MPSNTCQSLDLCLQSVVGCHIGVGGWRTNATLLTGLLVVLTQYIPTAFSLAVHWHCRTTVTVVLYSNDFNMPYRSDLPVPLNEYDHLWRLALDKGPSQTRKPAGLPVPNSTRSFWLHPSSEVNPLAKEGSQGSLSGDADICIIGSGITGISAAYHFAKAVANSDSAKSLKVVVLEARDFCELRCRSSDPFIYIISSLRLGSNR